VASLPGVKKCRYQSGSSDVNRGAVIKHHNVGQRRHQRGVSLLETICTMTILGSVSATAVPMVLDLPSQARVSVVQSMAGAVHSASHLVHMKCVVSPACVQGDGSGQVSVEGGQVKVARAYPEGGAPDGIENALDYSGFTPVRVGAVTVFQKDGARDMPACAVRYEAPAAVGGVPAISAVTTGC
jgi:prepilin-type N-terminal cleavage/methylation domain-containing protein